MLSPVRQVVVTPARGCTEWPQAPPPITQPFKYDELNRATNSEPPRWSLIASPSFTELFNEIRKSMPIELVKSAVNARQQFIFQPSLPLPEPLNLCLQSREPLNLHLETIEELDDRVVLVTKRVEACVCRH